jgi:hypothetical protein
MQTAATELQTPADEAPQPVHEAVTVAAVPSEPQAAAEQDDEAAAAAAAAAATGASWAAEASASSHVAVATTSVAAASETLALSGTVPAIKYTGDPIHLCIGPCLSLISAYLPLLELLSLRACGCASLEWAMQRCAVSDRHLGALDKVHDRIRTRLWIQRVSDLNKDSDDETAYETCIRSFANDALRRRMEAEMAEAKLDMERQIHAFQAEVDRRMEEQAVRVHAIVEERVQHQLDAILATEMDKVRTMVEERVQGRVRVPGDV